MHKVTKVTSFWPILWAIIRPIYHVRNYTIIYITIEKGLSSFTQMYKTSEKCI